MVKFGKNKFKALNKLAKKQNDLAHTISNKLIKKKINSDKKISFQKEVLLKESTSSALVKNITPKEIIINDLVQKSTKKKAIKPKDEVAILKQKKSVENKKKRQKTQINDTKLLLKLMKKNKQRSEDVLA